MKNETKSEIFTLERQSSVSFFRGREKPFIAQYYFLSTYKQYGVSDMKMHCLCDRSFHHPSNLEQSVGAETQFTCKETLE